MTIRAGMLAYLLVLLLTACSEDKPKTLTLPNATDRFVNSGQLALSSATAPIPALDAYWQKVQAALQQNPPVLVLDNTQLSDSKAQTAQQLALTNPDFLKLTRDAKTGEALRNEVMNVRPALAGDFQGALGACAHTECYRVEMYNHFYNASTIAFVDVSGQKVLGVSVQHFAQPDLPPHLVELASEIANHSTEVQAILGDAKHQPDKKDFKTALQDSMCERSHHLCVAPTYVFDNDALWAIVDLTDGKLIGTRWTELGNSGPKTVVTERSLENETTFRNFCQKQNSLSQDGWTMDYVITGSDGLQLTNVKFNDQSVIKNVKLLDWHVSYSSREGFGYSDAIGCPLFSAAVVIAYNGPKTEPIVQNGQTLGFAVVQDFRQPPWPTPCNYRYEQRFEFYKDGRFRVAQADLGRGCGTDGMYRPVVRIDLDTTAFGQADSFAEWDGTQWLTRDKEQWRLQDNAKFTEQGYQYKITGKNGRGYYIEPGRGQFGDGGRGDHAFTYISVYKPDEGEQDTVTLGSCCNADYKQGPEHFIEPAEPLANQDLVFWYVPQMKNDGAAGSEYCWADTQVKNGIQNIKVWPCYSGPMFVPVGQP
jgi:hypothetical protein